MVTGQYDELNVYILQEKCVSVQEKRCKLAGKESESLSEEGRQKGAILTRMHALRLEMERRGKLVDDQLFNGGKNDNLKGRTTLVFRASLPINRRSHKEKREHLP